METVKLKVLNAAGHTKIASEAGGQTSVVYTGEYEVGDRIMLSVSKAGNIMYCN